MARRSKAGFIYLQEVPSKFSGSSQHNASPQQNVLESKYRNLPYETQHCRLASFVSPSLAQTRKKQKRTQLDLKRQLKQTGCQFFHIVSRISIGRPHIPESSDWLPVCKELFSLPSTFRLPGSAAQNILATLVLLTDLPLALASIAGREQQSPIPLETVTIGSGCIAGTESSPQD